MPLQKRPVARATMLVRRPLEEVFNAFIDPKITTRFWFTRSSGTLRAGDTVTWYWDQYGVSASVAVTALEPNKRLLIEWPTPVDMRFTQRSAGALVEIVADGFDGNDDEVVSQVIDSTEGFNLVLAGCKAFLEYGIELNLVGDKNPDAAAPQDE